MNRRALSPQLLLIVWLVVIARAGSLAAQSAAKPNIVLILADDMGYGDLGCYGCPDIRTPSIDSLARQGLRLTSFYSNGPECTPTRTGLMSGRYQQRVGGLECAIGIGNVGRYDDAIRLANQHELGLPAERSVLARKLHDAGYATAICGKWHLGYEPKFLPLKHGFDYAFGFRHNEPGGEPMLYRNDRPVERKGYMTDLIGEEAVGFIQGAQQPFFLYVPFTAPHSPFQGPGDAAESASTADDMNRGSRGKYVEMVQRLDEQVGAILKAIDATGSRDKTLVIFASDNGGPQFSRNDPFSGRKGTTYEGGIRVPCLLRWPGQLAEGSESAQVGITMDLTASILRLAGVEASRMPPLDGIDLVARVQAKQPPIERTLYWRQRRGENTWRGVRDGDLKLVSKQDGAERQNWLFDLSADAGEKNDLSKGRSDELSRLQGLLAKWENAVQPDR
jgi:N-acetylgalactosamine-6-sulfatase